MSLMSVSQLEICQTPMLCLRYNKQTKGNHLMNTLERIRKEQQERYAIQREKDKAKIEAMFSNNPRPLNNAYLLAKEEN